MKEMPEQTKSYIFSLVSEFRDIVANFQEISKKPKAERMMIRNRLAEIKKELETIKEEYKE